LSSLAIENPRPTVTALTLASVFATPTRVIPSSTSLIASSTSLIASSTSRDWDERPGFRIDIRGFWVFRGYPRRGTAFISSSTPSI
jgi:hypothetical protein